MATYIGEPTKELTPGVQYNLVMQDMAGRIYKPGKTPDGKWLDKEGEQDERIMAYAQWGFNFYKVYETAADLLKEWYVYPPGGSPRVKAEILKRAQA